MVGDAIGLYVSPSWGDGKTLCESEFFHHSRGGCRIMCESKLLH